MAKLPSKMAKLPIKSLRLDPADFSALERLAIKESALIGSRVTAAAIVRRLIREYLRRVEAGRS
jgi:hypothetical protein